MSCSVIDAPSAITGVVLCGGQARRFGGLNKPLLADGRGAAVIDHVLERLAPQVGSIVISANHDVDVYRRRGRPVVTDEIADGGPLAGIHAAAGIVDTPWLFVCPGDAPGLPPSIVAELLVAVRGHAAAYAHDGQRAHYLHLLVRRQHALGLGAWLRSGERAVHRWLTRLAAAPATLAGGTESLDNLNSPAEYERWCQQVGSDGGR